MADRRVCQRLRDLRGLRFAFNLARRRRQTRFQAAGRQRRDNADIVVRHIGGSRVAADSLADSRHRRQQRGGWEPEQRTDASTVSDFRFSGSGLPLSVTETLRRIFSFAS